MSSRQKETNRHKNDTFRYSEFQYFYHADTRKKQPEQEVRKKRKPYLWMIVLVIAAAGLWYHQSNTGKVRSDKAVLAKQTTNTVARSAASEQFVVNKHNPFQPLNYVPLGLQTPHVPLRLDASDPEMQLRAPAAAALEKLVNDAAAADIHLRLSSGYRSYDDQTKLYDYYVSVQGQQQADEQSARPGYSEHQSGLAADVSPIDGTCDAQVCFGETDEGKWLAAHAYTYGFVIRYPQDKTAITGYEYEPWHVRFVGTDVSTLMHQHGITTLEEQFGLPAAQDYK